MKEGEIVRMMPGGQKGTSQMDLPLWWVVGKKGKRRQEGCRRWTEKGRT